MQNIIHKELQDINPYVRMCRCTETHTGWALIDRIIYDHQLVLVAKGHGETIIAGKEHSSSPGDLFLIKPGVVHSFIAYSENPLQMLVIHFDFFMRETEISGLIRNFILKNETNCLKNIY
ncbi:MAG: transcriptional regulator, AraC family [Clostridiales bacterium]|jgi:hypothetical protein|nr:transcriptional regulator, AraC family [Clostridiales bacterium]